MTDYSALKCADLPMSPPMPDREAVGVPNLCDLCAAHQRVVKVARGPAAGRMAHPLLSAIGQEQQGEFLLCKNYDDECRHGAEPLGFYTFAWLPVRTRNGKRRWLTNVERHDDGTYTLGNRAH